jgi:pSer/pThr/pTyr-binding forkhead associated (FHA) protein/class 3 adenylate cyclase
LGATTVRSWLRSRSSRDASTRSTDSAIELLVLEGADTGQSFTVDAEEAFLGRRLDANELRGGIVLRDSTVSSRQAVIRRRNGNHTIEHLSSARNPTLVNGSTVDSAVLVPGTQIQFGRVVMEVRSHAGTDLADFTQLFLPAAPVAEDHGRPSNVDTNQLDATTTEFTTGPRNRDSDTASSLGRLIVKEGPSHHRGAIYSLKSTRMLLGRGSDCDVQLKNLGVSRRHAEIVWQEGDLILHHLSSTNLTIVNDREVEKRTILLTGDKIVLAGRVEITVELTPSRDSRQIPIGAGASGAVTDAERTSLGGRVEAGLMEAMEQKVALNQRIIEDFTVDGSFLDVDVVNSHGMKSNISEPEQIIVSFERFRFYISEIVREFQGHVLNSNGDELMCFFESPRNAIRAGNEMLARLEKFNANENMLEKPFCFRIGVHTGRSLVDLKRGVAYSAILDVAGHLQKHADTNGMAISDHTLSVLESEGGEPPLSFRLGGTLEREGFDFHLLVRTV